MQLNSFKPVPFKFDLKMERKAASTRMPTNYIREPSHPPGKKTEKKKKKKKKKREI
jgi:hypothetical protein